jgi:hypothetical protein
MSANVGSFRMLTRCLALCIVCYAGVSSAEVSEQWADEKEWRSCVDAMAEQVPPDLNITIHIPPAIMLGSEPSEVFGKDQTFKAVRKYEYEGEWVERQPIIPGDLRGYRLLLSVVNAGKTVHVAIPCLIDKQGNVRTGSETLISTN